MVEMGIRALEADPSSVVAMAAAGEPVTVTDRGRPVVRMVAHALSRMEAMLAEGRARPALRRLSELPVLEPRQPGEPVLSEELDKMRSVERY